MDHFNACVSPAEAISIDELLNSPTTQKMLSTKIESKQFQLLFDASSIPNRARLMSASDLESTNYAFGTELKCLHLLVLSSRGVHRGTCPNV